MKLLLLLELDDMDILCIQESWLAAGAKAPTIPGYNVVEQRRAQGTHGGLATYFRQSIQLEATHGNEYGLHTKFILPTSQRINVINVYMPPYGSLSRKGIKETEATALLDEVIENTQLQLTTLICGDFNARIGTRTPLLDFEHPPRTTDDMYTCSRANWLIKMCEQYNMYILNGINSPAAYTCHRSAGESTVDYLLCNGATLQIK